MNKPSGPQCSTIPEWLRPLRHALRAEIGRRLPKCRTYLKGLLKIEENSDLFLFMHKERGK